MIVKSTRIWLILLLAVLLPVRSAMAAAMLCPPAGVGTQSEVHLEGVLHDDGAASLVASDHAAHHHGSSEDQSNDDASTADKCNVCSAFCSVTPLLSSVGASLAVREPSTTSFPDLSTPAVTFLSDGQERPPRST
ncbi:MAG: DUF2946 family protein [Caldimonas sp.]